MCQTCHESTSMVVVVLVIAFNFLFSGHRTNRTGTSVAFCLYLQLSSNFFGDLLDSVIVDVASECHRIARLGLDRNLEEEEEELRLSAQARVRVADSSNSSEANGKYVVDIFGQNHPSVASEIFDCMNCGRSIVAGRFAPHLEKCMGRVTLYPLIDICFVHTFCFYFLNLFSLYSSTV